MKSCNNNTHLSQAKVVVIVLQLHAGDAELVPRELDTLQAEHVARSQRGILLYDLLGLGGGHRGRRGVLGRSVLGAGDVDVQVAELPDLSQVAHVVLEHLDVLWRALHDIHLESSTEARFSRGPSQPPTSGHRQKS